MRNSESETYSDRDLSALPELVPVHALPRLIPSSRRGRKLSISTVFRWLQRGRLPSRRVGGARYVHRLDLLRFLAGHAARTAQNAMEDGLRADLDAPANLDQRPAPPGRLAERARVAGNALEAAIQKHRRSPRRNAA